MTARFNAGAVNAYEPQKIFKVKGTFVGHEGQVRVSLSTKIGALRFGAWPWQAICSSVGRVMPISSAGILHRLTALNELFKVTHSQSLPCPLQLVIYSRECSFQVEKLISIRTGLDCTIHIWNTANLTFVAKVDNAHSKAVSSIASNSGYVFTGSLNIIKVWRINTANSNGEFT